MPHTKFPRRLLLCWTIALLVWCGLTPPESVFSATYTYDPLNRLTSITYTDNSSTAIAYDSIGRPVSLTDSIGGRIDLAYDLLNRVGKDGAGKMGKDGVVA
jgi:hypothetical protein